MTPSEREAVAGVALAAAFVVAFCAVLVFGCSDGPDLIGPAQPAAVTAGEGCAPADAGADPCECPDGGDVVVLPVCGKVCGL